VSGGPDSVALLRALVSLKAQTGGVGRLAAAHFNHGLRGAESDRDERFVVELCGEVGVPCEVGRAACSGLTLRVELVSKPDSESQASMPDSESQARNVPSS